MNRKNYIMRKATLSDTRMIQGIINSFSLKNLMLQRSLNEIYENIRDFWVVESEGEVIACAALHPLWEDMAEIKSLAVSEDHMSKGLGRELVEACISECGQLEINKVFALTYVPGFFEKLGFKIGEKDTMPHKIWSECIKCPHFPDCDEILMVKELR